jgi:hypothetical protein
MKRFLSLIILAFAISLFTVSGASAYPVIDPPVPTPVLAIPTTQLTDGWYSAAVQQTIINAAKSHAPRYRTAPRINNHGPVLP